MKIFLTTILVFALLIGFLVACASEPIEVTRIVETETEVEVTRLVETEIEVEVTRLVEATVEVTRIVQEPVLITSTPVPSTATPEPSIPIEEQESAQLDLASFTNTWSLINEVDVSFVYDFREDGSYTHTFNGAVAESGTWEALSCNTVCLITQDRNPQCNIWVIRGGRLIQFIAGAETQYYTRQEAEPNQ